MGEQVELDDLETRILVAIREVMRPRNSVLWTPRMLQPAAPAEIFRAAIKSLLDRGLITDGREETPSNADWSEEYYRLTDTGSGAIEHIASWP